MNVEAVASMFGELQLIPQHILNDPKERQALAEALEVTFKNSLLYKSSDSAGDATKIPELKFDKLLDSLSRLVPRFQFDLPPYFINNARALSTLEGIAKSLDPTFNVLTIMYPYALNILLRNPSGSHVVASTLQSLIRSSDGRIDRVKIRQLLRDSALISKRRVVVDILKTREGRRLARQILGEELQFTLRRRGSSGAGRRKKQKRRWFYLEL
jgi:predicted unusual protein kinase regulating ubiquinone biosynthesis (AarF/ABC1/UbiB family)